MARLAFCSGTYQSISPNINAEFCMNLLPEAAASPNARSAIALLGTDGLSLFASLPPGAGESVPGGFTYKGRMFCVGITTATVQMHLYEVMQNGTLVDLSPAGLGAPVSTAPAIWAANPNQLVFTVGGNGFIYTLNLGTNVVSSLQPNGEPAAAVVYCDGFFVTFIQNTNTIMVSALEDGTTWPAINIASVSEFADNIVSMKVLSRTIWFQGQKSTVPYYNSGTLFPFVPIPGAFVEEGSAAAYGVEKLDNTLFWVGANSDEGTGMAWRLSGYTPVRISTHDVETAWQNYPRIDDVISSKFQMRGHKIWQLYFPTANATWRYDVSTGLWHQAGRWNAQRGAYDAHASQWHAFCFGKHLVGDPFSGNIYVMSPTNLTDNGTNIRRERIAPYIAKEHENEFHKKLELLMETGQVSQLTGPSVYPAQLILVDPTGVLWVIEITDAGNIVPSPAPEGSVASVPVLADNVNQSTFWQIAITVGGAVYGIPSSYGRTDVARLNLSTNGTFLDSGLQVNQQGQVTAVAPAVHVRPPELQMCYSDDGGHNWSGWHTASLGLEGDTRKRVIFRRLGKSRNRAYRVVITEPINPRIVDAFVNDPQESVERMSDQLRKMA